MRAPAAALTRKLAPKPARPPETRKARVATPTPANRPKRPVAQMCQEAKPGSTTGQGTASKTAAVVVEVVEPPSSARPPPNTAMRPSCAAKASKHAVSEAGPAPRAIGARADRH